MNPSARPTAVPVVTAEQVTDISARVAEYISSQRAFYSQRATPLSSHQREILADFFSKPLLHNTRVVVLPAERVPNPAFYSWLAQLGFGNLPDFSRMAAITFEDVVVSHEPFTPGLLFHEMVHVEQYRQLGIPRFAELYVRGFLKSGSYEAIPLEMNAYSLGERIEQDSAKSFSVEGEVRSWLAGEGIG